MALMRETVEQRARRERQRVLFDSVAQAYRETRQGYPDRVVRWMVEAAALGDGAAVLEVGCGTGQLTAGLAGYCHTSGIGHFITRSYQKSAEIIFRINVAV